MYRLFVEIKKRMANVHGPKESPYQAPDTIIDTYTQNLRFMASIMKGANIKGVFVLQPHIAFIDPQNEFQKRIFKGITLKKSFYPNFFNSASRSRIVFGPTKFI